MNTILSLEMRLDARNRMIKALDATIQSLRNDLRIQEDANRLLVNALKEINLNAHEALEVAGE